MQRAGALKNIEMATSVFIIPFQLASFTQGNEEISLLLSPSDRYTYSKYMSNEKAEVN